MGNVCVYERQVLRGEVHEAAEGGEGADGSAGRGHERTPEHGGGRDGEASGRKAARQTDIGMLRRGGARGSHKTACGAQQEQGGAAHREKPADGERDNKVGAGKVHTIVFGGQKLA